MKSNVIFFGKYSCTLSHFLIIEIMPRNSQFIQLERRSERSVKNDSFREKKNQKESENYFFFRMCYLVSSHAIH